MVKQGVVSPVEVPTDWCSGLVPVIKPTGKIRICVDLTSLNRAVKREIFPMKTVNENLAKLANGKLFSKLDANSGFWQIPLHDDSKLLTTFITPFGRFAFNRLPFGITSAPEIFQRTMSTILQGLEGVICHMDDILILGSTQLEHDLRVRQVLKKLQDAGLTLNAKKCEFSKTEVTYLGHVITGHGIRADPRKVKAIQDFPVPKTVQELQRFQGMVNQLAKFVPGLAQFNSPLRALLRKNTDFTWTSFQDTAFKKIKDILLSDIVLTHYDLTKPIVISADAAKCGIGAVLLQVQDDGNRRPVCFASRSLSETEQRYAVIEKEALAATWACEQFRDFILGLQFTLETDHKPLVTLLGSKDLANMPLRIQRFKMRLMLFDYVIQYVPGKLQVTADALSRAPLIHSVEDSSQDSCIFEVDCHASSTLRYLPASSPKLQEITILQKDDGLLSDVISYCLQGWPTYIPRSPLLRPYWENRQHLNVVDDLLLYNDRIVIPQKMQMEVLQLLHQGHLGITKCRARARESVWWPGISGDIQKMVENCAVCAKEQPISHEPLLPSSFPDRPWERIAMDLCSHNGRTYIIVVDYFSRWVEFRPIISESTRGTINALKSVFSVHGIPDVAVSDNGPQFSSKEFRQFTKDYGFTHVTSSPKYPASNGEAERAVRTFKELLKKNVEDIYLALLVHRSTPLLNGLSPSELLMRRKLRSPLPILPKKLKPGISTSQMTRVRESEKYYREQQRKTFGRRHRVKELPKLNSGNKVWIRDMKKEGTVVDKDKQPRSYTVQSDLGLLRRNRSALVKLPTSSQPATGRQGPPVEHDGPMTRSRAGKIITPPDRLNI